MKLSHLLTYHVGNMDKPNKYILILGIAIIAVCYFIWFSPLFIAIGAIMIIADLACYIHYHFKKDNNVVESTGCLCGVLFAILLVVAFFMGGDYKIFSFSGKRHLYENCQFRESSQMHEVRKMSALIWGCFEDCKFCKDRQKREEEIAEKKEKEEEKKENLEFINKQISELEEVRNAILRGEDVDIEDYEFSYEVEDAIRESAIEEYREGEYEPRGRR